jgi:hypothetical protein
MGGVLGAFHSVYPKGDGSIVPLGALSTYSLPWVASSVPCVGVSLFPCDWAQVMC